PTRSSSASGFPKRRPPAGGARAGGGPGGRPAARGGGGGGGGGGRRGRARAWAEERGSARVVPEAGPGRILGASILAYHASDLIHPVAVAMAGDGTGAAIDRAAHVHPTLGEVVKRAVAASRPG